MILTNTSPSRSSHTSSPSVSASFPSIPSSSQLSLFSNCQIIISFQSISEIYRSECSWSKTWADSRKGQTYVGHRESSYYVLSFDDPLNQICYQDIATEHKGRQQNLQNSLFSAALIHILLQFLSTTFTDF